MNKTQSQKKYLLIIVIFIFLLGTSSCLFIDKEEKLYYEDYYFSFSSDTIGNIDNTMQEMLIPVSLPYDEELDDIPKEARNPLQEAVYWNIVNYTFIWILNDSLNDWNLDYVYFITDCERTESFHTARFQFVKGIKTEDKEYESWFTRNIFIQTRNNSVFIREEEYYPKIFSRDVLEWERIRTFAKDALEIAEQNGGLESRKSVDYHCDIQVSMDIREKDLVPILNIPLVKNHEWLVRYSTNNESIFRYWVEPK